MSWTQVYVTGLSKSINPSDKKIENILNVRYDLTDDDNNGVMWAGFESTVIKRDEMGCCRGYAFLSFFTKEGATIIVDRMNSENNDNDNDNSNSNSNTNGGCDTSTSTSTSNNNNNNDDMINNNFPLQLKAELSNPKGAKDKNKNNKGTAKNQDLPDLRLRSKRKKPIRKHPVIISSDKTKTNQGNKTK
ncbi:MAG: hypothetical protein ACI90V_001721 [Bacillariaceae sp.]|jgi:hypothetical protein